jgi:uncharacterized protein
VLQRLKIDGSSPEILNSVPNAAAVNRTPVSALEITRRYEEALWFNFALSYLAIAVNLSFYSAEMNWVGSFTPFFAAAMFVSYPLFYMLPAQLLLIVSQKVLNLFARKSNRVNFIVATEKVLLGVSVLSFLAIQLILFTDRFVFHLYNFHLNGFIWNLVTTPGGIEAMGAGRSTQLTVGLIVVGFLLLQLGVLWLALRGTRVRGILARWFVGRRRWIVLASLLCLYAAQSVAYGVCSLRNYSPALSAAMTVPFYMPFTFRKTGRKLGLRAEDESSFRLKASNSALNYPVKPLEFDSTKKPLNVVWLVAESWRHDMLNEEVMPNVYAFARQSQWFHNHYSGGNGTRMGMFTMFYGLYGSYWFQFLAERRGPVLMDHILESNYQVDLHTSAEFTYPEFDKTLFARVPKGNMTTIREGLGWEKDRKHVGKIIDFIESRDKSQPFFAFHFFESPHAPYYFPDDTVIRPDYLQDFNYASMNLERNMPQIKNRYINSCHHLDQQVARIINYLRDNNLLDSTIVVLTGDHGEEFMEKGHWGHGGAFVDEQVRPPLVLWVPGRAPAEYNFLSSHLDIAPTVMTALGVKNPPEDYCLGFDLLGAKHREFNIIADWNRVCYMDGEYKAVLPTASWEMMRQLVTTRDDKSITDSAPFFSTRRGELKKVMEQMSRFSK